MVIEPIELSGAYGSMHPRSGIGFHARADALRVLAYLLDDGGAAELHLDHPPEPVAGTAVVALRFVPVAADRVEIRVQGDVIEFAGGSAARTLLAAELRMLADSPPTGHAQPRHLDVEYYPGHYYLQEGSVPMTVFLLSE